MRYLTLPMLAALALAVTGCNQSDRRDTRQQIHDARVRAKQDFDKAQREVRKDYKEADRQAERALSDARAKIRQTLHDQKVDSDHKNDDQNKP